MSLKPIDITPIKTSAGLLLAVSAPHAPRVAGVVTRWQAFAIAMRIVRACFQ